MTWPDDTRDFVVGARVARLATADAAGKPHIVAVCFALIDDRLYSVVDAKPKRRSLQLKRLRNIAENPQVAVLVDHYDDDWSRLRWAMLQGHAALVADKHEYAAGLEALRRRYEPYRKSSFSMSANPLLRVDVERVIGWRFATGA